MDGINFRPLKEFLPYYRSDDMRRREVPQLFYTYPFTGGSLPQSAYLLLLFKRDLHKGQVGRDITLFADDDDPINHIYSSEENSTLPVDGNYNAFIFNADRWNPSNTDDGRYVCLPVEFEGNKPVLRWGDKGSLEELK